MTIKKYAFPAWFLLMAPAVSVAMDALSEQEMGAQRADGFLGIGGDASTGAGADFGISSLSGYMDILMEGSVDATVCSGGANSSRTGCGILSLPLFTTSGDFTKTLGVSGNRMNAVDVQDIDIDTSLGTINANIYENLRFIHEIELVDTQDFSISFQSQSILWPGYNEAYPELPGGSLDTLQIAQRGWWMAIPGVELTGLYTETYLSSLEGIGGILGITLDFEDLDLGQTHLATATELRVFAEKC